MARRVAVRDPSVAAVQRVRLVHFRCEQETLAMKLRLQRSRDHLSETKLSPVRSHPHTGLTTIVRNLAFEVKRRVCTIIEVVVSIIDYGSHFGQ